MGSNTCLRRIPHPTCLNTLFSGAFSEVKLAVERSNGQKYAIKVIDKAKCKGKENMIEMEVNILKRVRHPNIVQLYEMYEFGGKIYLVMELVTGGELFDEIVGRGKYTEKETAKIVQRILGGIDYLHALGIVHRDLKPENLLLSEKGKGARIMISDFGLSKIFNEVEVMKTACGTPGYVAPEVLRRQGYGKEVDLWSLGVITYILLCGYPPFFDPNNVELFKKIMTGKFEFDSPWWDNISEKAKDFVRRLLVLDPKQRYSAAQALSHPFILEYGGPAEPLWTSANVNKSTEFAAKPVQLPHQILQQSQLQQPKRPSQTTAPAYPLPQTPTPQHITHPMQGVQINPHHSAPQPSHAAYIAAPASSNTQPSRKETLSTGKHRFTEPRPLSAKRPLDDSGIVTSNEGLAHSSHNGMRTQGQMRDIKGSYFSTKIHRITSWFRTGVAIHPSQKGRGI
ncbi:hypothetical protein BSLG_007318 [Batrachochytrium salamandrivorans]|nr:hypothetical protein BSLG_007318 [Batrachochytrium salamandrivorans]